MQSESVITIILPLFSISFKAVRIPMVGTRSSFLISLSFVKV